MGATAIEVSYLPGRETGIGTAFFWSRADIASAPQWPPHARELTTTLRLPGAAALEPIEVAGRGVEVGDATELLASTLAGPRRPDAEVPELADSGRALGAASAFVLDLIAREQFLPVAVSPSDEAEDVVSLRWTPTFTSVEDRRRRLALIAALPDVVCSASTQHYSSSAALLDRFWQDALDSLVRRAAPISSLRTGWEAEFVEELGVAGSREWPVGIVRARELRIWLPPPAPEEIWVGRARLRPPAAQGKWRLDFGIVSEESATRVDADEIATAGSRAQREVVARAQQTIAALVGTDATRLADGQAWHFISAARHHSGTYGGVLLEVPDEIVAAGRGGLHLLVQAGADRTDVSGVATASDAIAHLADQRLRWEVYLGDDRLEDDEIAALQSADTPLVQIRDRWVAADALDLARVKARLDRPRPVLSPGELVVAILDGSLPVDAAHDAEVIASADIVRLARALRGPQLETRPAPEGFQGTLRPYQARGLDWMGWLERERLGGILADDMGLGKGVQAIALILDQLAPDPSTQRPTLVVCPTSVIGNWERELETFAPELAVVRHHGSDRANRLQDLASSTDGRSVVLTTYALLRRDADLLAGVEWQRLILDEAQHVKNPDSDTARTARRIGANVPHRLALTGTPVENDLSELRAILEFANPGLLGSSEAFRTRFATPIEREGDVERARRLRQVTAPFVLRRSKSDSAVIADLPDKHETILYCNLTDEQANLYKHAVDSELGRIASASGIARRGRILALITKLKQICDHPELDRETPDTGSAGAETIARSGKLAHLAEMLDDVKASGDRSLVFTQYVRMGRIIAAAFDAPFYHGGLTQPARDKLVDEFQSDPNAADVLVMSTKAGGLGLNLTAATRVFHFDRWWNPAVEDQATDRAHRIGQTRDVWVHKLMCLGTLEERIDTTLEAKRSLARSIVSAGERWLTELDDDDLAELVRLEERAVV